MSSRGAFAVCGLAAKTQLLTGNRERDHNCHNKSAQKPHWVANLPDRRLKTPLSSEMLLTRTIAETDGHLRNLADLLDSLGAVAIRGS